MSISNIDPIIIWPVEYPKRTGYYLQLWSPDKHSFIKLNETIDVPIDEYARNHWVQSDYGLVEVAAEMKYMYSVRTTVIELRPNVIGHVFADFRAYLWQVSFDSEMPRFMLRWGVHPWCLTDERFNAELTLLIEQQGFTVNVDSKPKGTTSTVYTSMLSGPQFNADQKEKAHETSTILYSKYEKRALAYFYDPFVIGAKLANVVADCAENVNLWLKAINYLMVGSVDQIICLWDLALPDLGTIAEIGAATIRADDEDLPNLLLVFAYNQAKSRMNLNTEYDAFEDRLYWNIMLPKLIPWTEFERQWDPLPAYLH